MADASDCDGFNRVPTEEKEKEMAVSEEGEEERSRVLDLAKEAATAQEQPLAEAEKEHESLDLEAKKRRLLEELESALLPKGKPKDSTPTNQQDLPPPVTAVAGPSIGLGLGFEVIDETALVETLSLPSAAAGIRKGKKGSANVAEAKKDGNKQLASRRKAKKDARNSRARRNTTTTTTSTEAPNGKNMVKRRYSRKEMEALRFVNVDQQRNFWNEIYAGLRNHFANEYDTMAVSPVSGNGPRPLCLPNNKHAPPILSVGAANGRWRYMNVFVH